MDERPATRLVKAPDGVSLAYQVLGQGSVNIIWLPGVSYPVDLLWEVPGFSHFARRLGSFTRTLWPLPRGFGASSGNYLDNFDESVFHNDVTVLLDAVGWDQAALVGASLAAGLAVGYAATHPERISALVLIDGQAHYVREDDYPIGLPPNKLDEIFEPFQQQWGSGAWLELGAPSRAHDPLFREAIALCERFGQSPDTAAEALKQICLLDVRHYLPVVSAPTLVLHRTEDKVYSPEAGRYMAQHISGARYVELPGDDHLYFVGDTDALLDEVEEFLTGSRQGAEGDVVTSTIVFTDIVSSTEQAARMGHRKWSALSDAHDVMVRAALARYRGREVKTLGDGFLATFDATTRAVRAAADIVTQAKVMGIVVRAGVHIGEVEVRSDDVVGLSVNIAKRICDAAQPGQVYASEAVRPVVAGSGIEFDDRGEHDLKGVPGRWRLFAVEG